MSRCALLLLVPLALHAADPSLSRLEAEWKRLAEVAGGRVGAAAVHIETGRRIALNGGERFPMASTYKVPIAVRLFDLIDKGEVQLGQMVTFTPSDLHPGSGILTDLFKRPGLALSVHNLLELMLLISDNSATDVLLNLAGGGTAVTARMRELGFLNIRVDRPTIEMIRASGASRRGEGPKFDDDPQDTAAPAEMVELLTRIQRKSLHGRASADLFVDILERCRTGDARIKGLLPRGTVVAHKTGTISQSANDVGILRLPGGAGHLALAVFVKGSSRDAADRDRAIAEIARAAHDYFVFQPQASPHYVRIAEKIVASLQPTAEDKAFFGGDPQLWIPLRRELAARLTVARSLDEATIFLWLPYGPGNPSAMEREKISAWTAGGGARRQLHFHWDQGSVGADGRTTVHPAAYDTLYERAPDFDGAALRAQQQRAAERLRQGWVRVTTPEGTDLRFRTGDRPFNLQDGDASAARARQAVTAIDRDIELPPGVLRVAPAEETVRGILAAGGQRFVIRGGMVTNPKPEFPDRFREFGLGFHQALRPQPGESTLPYFGYGAGVVRMSLGDNQELGGKVKGGGVRWFFFANATVTIEGKPLVQGGKLVD